MDRHSHPGSIPLTHTALVLCSVLADSCGTTGRELAFSTRSPLEQRGRSLAPGGFASLQIIECGCSAAASAQALLHEAMTRRGVLCGNSTTTRRLRGGWASHRVSVELRYCWDMQDVQNASQSTPHTLLRWRVGGQLRRQQLGAPTTRRFRQDV